MGKLTSLKTLSSVIFGSAIFDLFGGFYFILLVGVGKQIADPPTHTFFAVLLGTFLICFAYLQFMTARNIKRYFVCIGVALLSRIFYVFLFAYYYLVAQVNLTAFLPTAIADFLWVILIVVLVALNREVSLKELYVPKGIKEIIK